MNIRSGPETNIDRFSYLDISQSCSCQSIPTDRTKMVDSGVRRKSKLAASS